jgi:hypothetical protein
MIELHDDTLEFRFPEVHETARCRIDFQRTLRIPDDNRSYPLPPGLGRFPLAHVDDFADRLPPSWRTHGGVFLPMYQAEAMWLHFGGRYPCAIKIAAGKINAVTGKAWSNGLTARPQDYVVVPEQPWLDGFCVTKGLIRQFVAMPLGEGFTAEEQLTGEATHGGLQLVVYPMKREVYRRLLEASVRVEMAICDSPAPCPPVSEMGLAPGGLMRQHIYEDDYGIDAWDQAHGSRCFVHIANSVQYQQITGRAPPHAPPSAQDYSAVGLPWFAYYDDRRAVEGSPELQKLLGVAAVWAAKGKGEFPGNAPVAPKVVRTRGVGAVREGEF